MKRRVGHWTFIKSARLLRPRHQYQVQRKVCHLPNQPDYYVTDFTTKCSGRGAHMVISPHVGFTGLISFLFYSFLSLLSAGFDGRLRCSMRLHYQMQRRVVGDKSRLLTTASSTSSPVRRRANLLPNQQSKEQKFVGGNTRCMATASLTSLPSAAQGWPFIPTTWTIPDCRCALPWPYVHQRSG